MRRSVTTCDTVQQNRCGFWQVGKIQHHTCIHGTCDPKTVGLPAPVQNTNCIVWVVGCVVLVRCDVQCHCGVSLCGASCCVGCRVCCPRTVWCMVLLRGASHCVGCGVYCSCMVYCTVSLHYAHAVWDVVLMPSLVPSLVVLSLILVLCIVPCVHMSCAMSLSHHVLHSELLLLHVLCGEPLLCSVLYCDTMVWHWYGEPTHKWTVSCERKKNLMTYHSCQCQHITMPWRPRGAMLVLGKFGLVWFGPYLPKPETKLFGFSWKFQNQNQNQYKPFISVWFGSNSVWNHLLWQLQPEQVCTVSWHWLSHLLLTPPCSSIKPIILDESPAKHRTKITQAQPSTWPTSFPPAWFHPFLTFCCLFSATHIT